MSAKGLKLETENKSGISETGISTGNIDIAIFNNNNVKVSIIEALKHRDKNYLEKHLNKLVKNYNPLKLKYVFLLTYNYNKEFNSSWDSYKNWYNQITNDKIEYSTLKIKLEENINSQIFKFAYSDYLHDEEIFTRIYHVFVNFFVEQNSQKKT